MEINLQYSEASLFDSSEPDDTIDMAASARRYGSMVTNALVKKYPMASLSVILSINDRLDIDGNSAAIHPEGPWVGEVISGVFSSWDWIVEDEAIRARHNAIAAIAKNKREARQLMAEIEARIAAIPDDTTDWGHAGDAARMVANLRIAAGYED